MYTPNELLIFHYLLISQFSVHQLKGGSFPDLLLLPAFQGQSPGFEHALSENRAYPCNVIERRSQETSKKTGRNPKSHTSRNHLNEKSIMSANLVYLTTQGNDGIWTFNLNNPEIPPSQISSTANLGFIDLVLVDKTLFLTAEGNNGIWTFNVDEPGIAPTQLSSTANLGFRNVIQVGSLLYLTTQGSDGIWTFQIENLGLKPVQISSTQGLGFEGLIPSSSK